MALSAIFSFRNLDSTEDLNTRYRDLFNRGIYNGGIVTPVAGQLKVDVTSFLAMSYDGMMVKGNTTERLDVVAGQNNFVVCRAVYSSSAAPTLTMEVLEESVYNGDAQKDNLIVFATLDLSPTQTEVFATDVSTLLRDEVDPVGRLHLRGNLASDTLLPGTDNRAGDFYVVTDGTGDIPNIHVWNGVIWVNVTTAGLISSELALHRQNLFTDEIHLTDLQAAALIGTSGTPPSGTNPFIDNADPRIPTLNEKQALAGSDGTPSSSNKYITEEKILAVSDELVFPVAPSGGTFDAFAAILPFTPTSGVDWDGDNVTFGAGTAVLAAVAGANLRNKGVAVSEGDQLDGSVTFTGGTIDVTFEETSNLGTPLPGGSFPGVASGVPVTFIVPAGVDSIVMRMANNAGTGSTITTCSLQVTAAGSFRFSAAGAEGPFYVGTGGVGSYLNLFNLFNVDGFIDKEYANSLGEPVRIIGIYTDSNYTNLLIPSTDINVDANGFYGETGTLPLYFLADKEINTGFRLVYGRKKEFGDVPVDMLLRRGPKSGQLDRRLSGVTRAVEEFHAVSHYVKSMTDVGANTYAINSSAHVFLAGDEVILEGIAINGTVGTSTRERTSAVATIVTASPHGITDGQSVDISGMTDGTYDAVGATATVVDDVTFSYSNAGPDEATIADLAGTVDNFTDYVTFNGPNTVGVVTDNTLTVTFPSGRIYLGGGSVIPENKTDFEIKELEAFNVNDSVEDILVRRNGIHQTRNDESIRPVSISDRNKYIDILDSTSTSFTAILTLGVYFTQDELEDLASDIQTKLNGLASGDTFGVSYNGDYTFTILNSTGNFSLLFATGPNSPNNPAEDLGFTLADLSGTNTYTSDFDIHRGLVKWEKVSTTKIRFVEPVPVNSLISIEKPMQDTI